MYSVVFASEAHASLLLAALPQPSIRVHNRAAFVAETAKPGAVAFVDCDLFHEIEYDIATVPVVGIVDDSQSETLRKAVRAFASYPWLSHVVVSTMLSSPLAQSHLARLLERLPSGPARSMLGVAGVGRVALLTQASRREARLDRMREFFAKHGLSERTISTIADVSEELVTNALYDAPVEAGFFKAAIPRTEDVALPAERACEISYGIDDGIVFVRLRDTFGALTRPRLLGVLTRCNTRSVKLDESRGGAGLGLWRVFSAASTLAITIDPGCSTDILIGIATKEGRLLKQLLAVDLYFVVKTTSSLVPFAPYDEAEMMDESVTLVRSS